MPISPVPVEALPPLYSAAGAFVISWGLTESALVNIIAIVYQKAGGRHVSPQVIPVAFKRRAEFLKRCFKTIDTLKPFADEMRAIIQRAGDVAQFRDTFAHGALASFDPATGLYTFFMLNTDDAQKFHVLDRVHVTLESIKAMTIESMEVTRLGGRLQERLMQAFVR